MFEQAEALAAERIPVVLDGTFSTIKTIERARRLADGRRSVFIAVECVCRREVAHQRLSQRLVQGSDVSDARPDIHDLQRNRWQTWPSEVPQLRVDTELPLDRQVHEVIERIMQTA